MKISVAILCSCTALLLARCNSEQVQDGTPQVVLNQPAVQIRIPQMESANGKAMLLGDYLQLYDSALSPSKDINAYNGVLVNITAVSGAYYRQDLRPVVPDSFDCQTFRFVRIKHEDFEGLVQGGELCRLEPAGQSILLENDQSELYRGIYYTPELPDECIPHWPLILKMKSTGQFVPVRLLNGSEFEIYYPYLELAPQSLGEEAVTIKIAGTKKEIRVNLPISDNKGDAPELPNTVEIKKLGNGTYGARLLVK